MDGLVETLRAGRAAGRGAGRAAGRAAGSRLVLWVRWALVPGYAASCIAQNSDIEHQL